MLELKNIKKVYELGKPKDKNYQTVEALRSVNVSFRDSEFVAILGPSGCGKTTLLNIIGGLDQYTSGDLIINNVSTKEFSDKDWDNYRNHKVGFVFQSYNLIPHQTVIENVELALTLSGVSKEERQKKAADALIKVGLGDKIHAKPSQLSGGQMQRVAIARAIVNDPDIILADEPTGALDTKTSVQIMDLLKEIAGEKLIVMVTHNPDLANKYATRIIRLLDGMITDDSLPFNQTDLPDTEEIETKKDKKNKTSMSFWTALSLSGKNLLTKKGRTALVSFAGSIGIIGISLILSLSNGFQLYINKVQEDTLSTYPLTVTSSTLDYTSMMEMLLDESQKNDEVQEDGAIHPNDLMTQMVQKVLKSSNTNDLKEFKSYIDSSEEFKDFIVKYTYNLNLDIYDGDDSTQLNPMTVFTDLIYNVVVEYNKYNGTSIPPEGITEPLKALNTTVYSEMLDSMELLDSQYELVGKEKGSRWATEADEAMLVVKEDYTLDDYNLYALGLSKEPTLEEIAEQIVLTQGDYEISASPISYEEVLNKSYRILLPTDFFKKEENGTYTNYTSPKEDTNENADFNKNREDFIHAQLKNENVGLNLKIVGIIRPKENSTASSITTAVGYTSKLTQKYITSNNEAEIMKKQLADPKVDVLTGLKFSSGEKTVDEMKTELIDMMEKTDIEDLKALASGSEYGPMMDGLSEEQIRGMFKGFIQNSSDDNIKMMYQAATSKSTYEGNLQLLGKVDLDRPSSISFFVNSFEAKEVLKQRITEYNDYVKSYDSIGKENDLYVDLSRDENGSYAVYKKDDTTWNYLGLIKKDQVDELPTKNEETGKWMYGTLDTGLDGETFTSEIIKKNETPKGQNYVISYSDYIGLMMSSISIIIDAISYVLIAFVSVSLVVSSIMIGIITYISVLERTKEIGVLRSIGASKKDIRHVFTAESLIIGFIAGVLGIGVTLLLDIPINFIISSLAGIYNVAQLPWVGGVILVILSCLLTLIAGLIPSKVASKKDPVIALRSE